MDTTVIRNGDRFERRSGRSVEVPRLDGPEDALASGLLAVDHDPAHVPRRVVRLARRRLPALVRVVHRKHQHVRLLAKHHHVVPVRSVVVPTEQLTQRVEDLDAVILVRHRVLLRIGCQVRMGQHHHSALLLAGIELGVEAVVLRQIVKRAETKHVVRNVVSRAAPFDPVEHDEGSVFHLRQV